MTCARKVTPPAGRIVILVFLSLWLAACADRPRECYVIIQKGNPLKFALSGSQALKRFAISRVDLKQPPNSDSFNQQAIYWELRPGETRAAESLDKIGNLNYGQTPNGFVQIWPKVGNVAPLEEGVDYWCSLETTNDLHLNLIFVVRNGEIMTNEEK